MASHTEPARWTNMEHLGGGIELRALLQDVLMRSAARGETARVAKLLKTGTPANVPDNVRAPDFFPVNHDVFRSRQTPPLPTVACCMAGGL